VLKYANRLLAIALFVGFVIALGGCGGKPMPFPTPESELGDRPGLLTGEKGAWQLYPAAPAPPQPP
jgi:hypothetical protein